MSGGALLRFVAAFGSGLVFAIGLGIAGMTRPSKVVGFLDLFGRWDASLALVMGGAVSIGLVSFALILRRASPVLASRFLLPAARGVDARLLFGSALFGVGWGLAGVCPGPALVATVTGAEPVLIFVAAMVAGAFAADHFVAPRVSLEGVVPEVEVARGAAEVKTNTEAAAAPPPPAPWPETICG